MKVTEVKKVGQKGECNVALQTFLVQEEAFEKEHKADSDEELITYVRKYAEELGRRPNKRDVIGYTYLKKRLGPWHRILEQAGLKEKQSKQLEKEQRQLAIKVRQEKKKLKKQQKKLRDNLKDGEEYV